MHDNEIKPPTLSVSNDSKPRFRDDSKEHLLFGKDVSRQFSEDLEDRVLEQKKVTVKKIKDVKLKEIDNYKRISKMQRSALSGGEATR